MIPRRDLPSFAGPLLIARQPNDLIQRILFLSIVCFLACSTTTQAQVNWTQYSGNPVINVGPPGTWDKGTVFLQTVIQEGDTLKMWYAGSNTSHIFDNNFSIGYSWSTDSINWTKYSDNPILSSRPGMWDQFGVGHPIVIQDGDTLRMWYESYTATTPGTPGHMIGYALSVDGIDWARRDEPVLERGLAGEWDDSYIVTGAVVKEDGTFRMWYSGGTGGTFPNAIMRMGLATSTDGINWKKYDDPLTTDPPFQFSDPVLPLGSSVSWEAIWVWTPSVLTTPSGYEMWYEGINSPTDNAAIGYATSQDGINWIKDANNPILKGEPGSWASALGATSVLRDGNDYRMWLSGIPDFFPFPGRIGYATATVEGPTDVEELPSAEMPSSFTLYQNYPNPFNPTTTINFDLPQPSHVTLTVYDVMGRELVVLVDDMLPAGVHRAQFDATAFPSGTYLYKLQTPQGRFTKGMVVLR